jgi:peptidoglycan/LPS O-acetylase OafA/YrhL
MAVVSNAVASHWMDHHSISAPPSVAQLLAHVFYLQDILGYQALSAGIWYLAIDFQLFALVLVLTALTRWLARALALRPQAAATLTRATLATLAVASLFWFNRDSGFDRWAIYFFGAYFVGMVLRWALAGLIPSGYLWAYLVLMMAAVAVEWRVRLLVAALTAVIVMFAGNRQILQSWPKSPLIAYLGQTSFSLFLVHFPVCLVVNAWFSRYELSPGEAWLAMFVAYGASLVFAAAFYRIVEQPFARGSRYAVVTQA